MNNNSIIFDLDIYDYNSICKGIEDYTKIAQINLTCTVQECICTFNNCMYELSLTQNEFENYVLGLTIKKQASYVLE